MAEPIDKKPFIKSVSIPGFTVNSIMGEYFEAAIKSGLYGRKANEVAKALFSEALRNLVYDGRLDPITYVEKHHKPEENTPEEPEEDEP